MQQIPHNEAVEAIREKINRVAKEVNAILDRENMNGILLVGQVINNGKFYGEATMILTNDNTIFKVDPSGESYIAKEIEEFENKAVASIAVRNTLHYAMGLEEMQSHVNPFLQDIKSRCGLAAITGSL